MNQKINQYRNKIDKIDRLILEKLSERMDMARLIGKIKTESGLVIYDREREKEMNDLRQRLAKELRLDGGLVEKIFKLIISESKKVQL